MAKQKKELGVTVELRKFMHAAPFSPFYIKTTDGDTFTIAHPDFAMISPSGDMAVIYANGEAGHRVLNLRQVVSMESVGTHRKTGKR